MPAAVAMIVATAAGAARAKAYLIPHVLEKQGTINSVPYTFDTSIYATYVSGLACVGPKLPTPNALYLYDDSGKPMRGLDGSDVCNPCALDLDATHTSRHVTIEDLFAPSGGLQGIKLGFGIAVVGRVFRADRRRGAQRDAEGHVVEVGQPTRSLSAPRDHCRGAPRSPANRTEP